MSNRITTTDLGFEFNLAHGRVRSLLAQAGVDRDARKMYDAELARDVLRSNINTDHAVGNRLAGRGAGPLSREISELAAAKLESEKARCEKLRQETDLRAGRLVSKADVIEAGQSFATSIRINLMGIPASVSSRLVGKSADQIAAALEIEIRHALTNLADIENYIFGDVA